MPFDNQVNPNEFYMTITEAMQVLGLERAQVHTLQRKKLVEWDVVGGRSILYRASVLAYKDRMQTPSEVRNPYQRREAQHA